MFLSNGKDGDYISYDTYAKYYRENAKILIGRQLTPHCLRYTHTAMLAEAGVDLDTISRRLGHADRKITKEVYIIHACYKQNEKT